MKVYLHNMETSEDTEVLIPELCNLRVVLDGPVPGRGAKTQKILHLTGDNGGALLGEVLDLHAQEGLIVAIAPSSNNWQIGITG